MVRRYLKKCLVCKKSKKLFKNRVTCSASCARSHKNNDKLRYSRKRK